MSADNASSSPGNTGVQISREEFQQVQYLLEQSERGNHVLFDRQALLEAFNDDGTLAGRGTAECSDAAVESHLQNLLATPSLRGKRLYFERLDRGTRNRIVRVYFGIIENTLFERPEARH